MPDGYERAEPLNLLLLNDGQEAENLRLNDTLDALYNARRIKPVLWYSRYTCRRKERLQEYGVAGKPDFKQRGAKAAAYTKFITDRTIACYQKRDRH